jgi:hypothetical protein
MLTRVLVVTTANLDEVDHTPRCQQAKVRKSSPFRIMSSRNIVGTVELDAYHKTRLAG